MGHCADRGFTFFAGDDSEDEWLRYPQLHAAAMGIAVELASSSPQFERRGASSSPPRVMVLCPPGPSYLKALFGTLYAGMIAVTAYPPRARRRDQRLDVVIEDCGATIALVDQTIFNRREHILKASTSLAKLHWINVDALPTSPAAAWKSPTSQRDDLAVLQYTSGSTSNPKGVCLTHGNLLANLQMIYEIFEVKENRDRWCVTWLPPYHDMGLIGGLLQVMYAGVCTHVLPPASFIQKPIRWLRAITKYNASISGGPNFAYDACVDRISAAEMSSIDLSSWTLAFTGAEPIRPNTLKRFQERFAPRGFRSDAFFPCYGLAEATLIVSGGPRTREPKVTIDHAEAAQHTSGTISCGRIIDGQQVRIIDPSTLEPKPAGTIGEIWVAGQHVSPGYWENSQQTQTTFGQTLPGEASRFMRTGDLGFLEQDELYVSGRHKELIVIRGRNFQPSDLEAAISDCSPLLVANASAAFEINRGVETGLVIVHEVERRASVEDLAEVAAKVRARLVERFELAPKRVVLIPKRSLQKTSSGKVKRLKTKELFEAGELDELSFLRCERQPSGPAPETVTGWLVQRLARQLQVDASEIDVARPFVQYGLDSVSAVQIAAELESFVGEPIPATLLYEAPTINAVAAKLSRSHQAGNSPAPSTQLKELDRQRNVAVIGVACRLPGCDDIEDFWRLLSEGRTAITDPPPGREACVDDTATTRRGGWLVDPDLFDAALFGISPREARAIDPQHRLLLETTWRAIEDSGIDPLRMAETETGVFVGIANRDYERLILADRSELSTYAMTGNAASMAAHRVSYHLNLIGPSLAVDTACSSSLVAVHQAVRALQAGDCDSAIVAGVNLILSPEVAQTLSHAEMLSPAAQCQTFDAAADGYVRGEGCVAFLLKPLADAIRDGDRVRSVIRGSAINQDGLTNGITAPNGDSQVRLYRKALADAQLRPDEVTLIEAHGTGTPLGDPIEVQSLSDVYGSPSGDSLRCELGALKANVGHLEAAAGMAGMLKVILELQHRRSVPQPNLRQINPLIDLRRTRIAIPTEVSQWLGIDARIAAVSSFGFGGTNAHVLLSEPERRDDLRSDATTAVASASPAPDLVTLSARSGESLRELAVAHARAIVNRTDVGAKLDAFAIATRRQKTSHRHRLAVVGDSAEMIANRLRQFADGDDSPSIHSSIAPADRPLSVAFMFSGQGAQYVGMGRGLYQQSPEFRSWIDRCDELLRDEFGYSAREVISSPLGTNGAVAGILEGPGAQTSLVALQLALAKTFQHWGVHPTVVMGHSIGEYAAAVTSGVMSWKDALRLTAARAQRVAEIETDGAMAVVFASLDCVQERISQFDSRLTIAAIDGPDHVVVSGPAHCVRGLTRAMEEAGTVTRPLRIRHAFHSSLIEPALATIDKSVSAFDLRLPSLAYVSTLTGDIVNNELTTSDYWVRHSRQPVQFVTALESLEKQHVDLVIEIGPHSTLCTLAQLNRHVDLNYQPTLLRGGDDRKSILDALGNLYVRGANIQWQRLDPQVTDSPVILPGHPFHRERFWFHSSSDDVPAEPVSLVSDRLSAVPTVGLVSDSIQTSCPEAAEAECKVIPVGQDQLARYAAAMLRVDGLVREAMASALSDLGGPLSVGCRVDPGEWVRRSIVAPQHQRLLSRMCEILEEDGVLRRSAESSIKGNVAFVVVDGPRTEIDWQMQTSAIEADYPEVRFELRLVERCGRSLARVLRGELDPLALLFPGGDASDLEQIYGSSPISRCSNQLVAQAALAVAKTISGNDAAKRPLRVLEIGAGTGGTTSYVLPAIADHVERYVFSDTSPLLLHDSASRFASYPQVDFQRLDIERSPAEQGFTEHSFDLVIGANVFHATRDLKETLANVRRLTRPGGFLIALEGVRRERFLDLVFGMTEGWWRFADRDVRESYPLLAESAWMGLLAEVGFIDAQGVAYPAGQEPARQCQAVLIASTDASVKADLEQPTGPVVRTSSLTPRRVGNDSSADVVRWVERYHGAAKNDRREPLEGYFRQTVANVLGHRPDSLDLEQPVSNLGIDSLMAIQLKNRLEADLSISVPMIAFLEGKSLRQLIDVAIRSGDEAGTRAPRDQPTVDEFTIAASDRQDDSVVERAPRRLEDVGEGSGDSGERLLGPMSKGQLALWLIHQRAPRGPAYNFAFAARATGSIDHSAMTKACLSLVKRHPVLRTCYRLDGALPARVLSPVMDVAIGEKDCRDWKESRVLDWIRQEADRPFDLEHGPVIRFSLLHCKTGDVLAIAMHHIAADLWSMDVLIQELIDHYAMIVGGGTMELGPLPTTYDNYVDWEEGLDDSEEGETLWQFWRDKLEGSSHTLALPISHPRPPEQSFNGDSLEWTVPPEFVDALRDVANAERTTLFTIVLAAYQAFLSRVCNQDDLLVGTVSASRGRSEWEGIVGYFLNHLVLRTRVVGSPSFRDFLRDSQREVLDALEHQAFPFAKLVENVRPVRDPSRSPLVQTMFIWDKPRHLKESHFAPGKSSDRLRLKPLLMEQRGAPFDLTLIAFELEEELKLTFRYNTDLFSRQAIESLAAGMEAFVEAVAIDPDTSIRSAPLLNADQADLIATWNATDAEFDPRNSGYELFRSAVDATPDAPAIESPERTLSYAEAEQRVCKIAATLRRVGVRGGDVVGLLHARSADAIVCILGIWKAGAAYLPLDPDHPTGRLQSIIGDATPRALLVSADTIARHDLSHEGVTIDVSECVAGPPAPDLRVDARPESPAYLIYTSGSTGKPKGVVVPHRGVANLALAQRQAFGVRSGDRCLQFASFSFDASVFEMLMAFHAGATLYVLGAESLRSETGGMASALRAARVNIATLPPSLLAAIPATDLPDLHTLISAGEACSASIVNAWSPGRRMFNAYGPTEATVWASTRLCEVGDADPTLGQPIANVRLYVVDANLEPTPIGIPGELCIGGPGLATEYKNLPQLTSEQFVPNPFDARFDASLYRTGDRGRWTHDGELEFLGRLDDQTKIDGHRIEPGEIAGQMRRMEQIENAYVVTHGSDQQRYLVAYYATAFGASIDEETMRRHLSERLPSYMVPKQFVQLPAIPLTRNGKVDVDALPIPDRISSPGAGESSPPKTPTEKSLAGIFCEVLRIEEIGIHDNFFDLGGASLQALQAADLASQRGHAVSAERMFQYQTVAELARELDGLTSEEGEFEDLALATSVATAPASPDPVSPHPASPHPASPASPSPHPFVEPVTTRGDGTFAPPKPLHMAVESIGMYLPPDTVSTEEIIRNCRNPLDFPLQKMTGIELRHVAGRDEFSIDLATKAALDCLEHSRFEATDVDLLIASNISRYDGKDFQISYEPSTASKLKRQLGATDAVAFDVCNACAGFFTALSIAESRLLSGQSNRAMIVSGEYISHLTKTAQLEINGFLDPRLACLTLGDAGVAVIVELTDNGFGFETLDLYTSGRHHGLCVAKATDQPHGGAIMLTDAIKASAVTLDHSVRHAHQTLQQHDWSPADVQHVIMHQTSATTLDGAIEELNRHFGQPVCSHENTVNNLRLRGNTASTTHWVAVMDLIREGRLKSGDKVVFAISGSGQTIGTALYQFDDLPGRMRGTMEPGPSSTIRIPYQPKYGVRVVAATMDDASVSGSVQQYSEHFVVESAARASHDCLRQAGWVPNQVEALIHAGVYRDAFLSEPAVAAILAGELEINLGRPDATSRKTIAFDLSDGGRGSLTASSVLATMIRRGQIERGLLTASEVEINALEDGPRGVDPVGSAIALERCEDAELGFQDFFFRSYPEHAEKLQTSTRYRNGKAILIVERSEGLESALVECVADCVRKYAEIRQVSLDDYDAVAVSLPPSISLTNLAGQLNLPAERLVLAESESGDPFTSGLALLFRDHLAALPKDHAAKWLVIAAGAGIEVGCVEYRT